MTGRQTIRSTILLTQTPLFPSSALPVKPEHFRLKPGLELRPLLLPKMRSIPRENGDLVGHDLLETLEGGLPASSFSACGGQLPRRRTCAGHKDLTSIRHRLLRGDSRSACMFERLLPNLRIFCERTGSTAVR